MSSDGFGQFMHMDHLKADDMFLVTKQTNGHIVIQHKKSFLQSFLLPGMWKDDSLWIQMEDTNV